MGKVPLRYLFKDEIFPCWYRSAPPKDKNQQVRKATDLCLLGERLDSGAGLCFAPFMGRLNTITILSASATKGPGGHEGTPHSARERSPGLGSKVTPFPPGCPAPL